MTMCLCSGRRVVLPVKEKERKRKYLPGKVRGAGTYRNLDNKIHKKKLKSYNKGIS